MKPTKKTSTRMIYSLLTAAILAGALISIGLLMPPTRAEAQTGPSIVMLGFGQERTQVVAAAIVTNTDPNLGFESMPVQVSVFNAAGAPIAANSGYLDMLFPAGKTAYIASIYPPNDERAARVTMSIGRGRSSPTNLPMLFNVSDVVFRPDRYFSKATGLLVSGYPKGMTYIHVTAVAFDGNGAIVGGGHQYTQVPALGQVAVDPPVTVSTPPAWIEMYASMTTLTHVE